VLKNAISDVQMIERSISKKTLSDLQVRLALRSCLKELRSVAAAAPSPAIDSAARESHRAG
jgi:hypothetical protein